MPPQLTLHHGNRLEQLADALAEVLREPLRSPFARERIVIQSKGMERWVTLQLASRWGICGNCEFPFPNALLRGLYSAVLEQLPEPSQFDPDFLLWRILECLPDLCRDDAFAPLRRHLDPDDRSALRRLQLADRIARTFDHYLVYRQDLLRAWRRPSADDDWQARLWRHLLTTIEEPDPTEVSERFLQQLKTAPPNRESLPQRLSVFGISYLPPLYLEVLHAVSRWLPVHVFVLNPCREYWFDIFSPKHRDHLVAHAQTTTKTAAEDLHLDHGHPLLASMGTQGRYFLGLAFDRADETQDHFIEPSADTRLARLQRGILALAPESEAGTAAPSDASAVPSIQVHCCHSPMREVEVLRDCLLERFARDPTLKPADVLVMTPDIDSYAPFIAAVFDAPAEESQRIPYSLADRAARRESPETEVLLSFLTLAEGRFGAPEVLDFLARPLVRGAFGIGAAEIETIQTWVRDSGIRWGRDEDHRRNLGLPPVRENTWAAGLDRLLLGYAMAPEGARLVAEVAPAGLSAPGDGPLLGQFAAFVGELSRQARRFEIPAPLHEWAKRLLAVVDRFIDPNAADPLALDRLRAVIGELSRGQECGGFDGDLDGPALNWLLERRFDRGAAGSGFLGGGVTVCATLPMRSIPFRVIALLGLNHGVFPRPNEAPGFNRIALEPRPGDPSPREDDRYLFLETLVSARDAVHLSYVGQSVRDNSAAPPSVLVSELLDHLEQWQHCDPRRPPILIEHRLHPFSPAYFRGDELFSYAADHCATARALVDHQREAAPFCANPLPEPDDSQRIVTLDELNRFLANPARTFLAERLKLDLDEGPEPLEDREPFAWSQLDRWQLGDQLLRAALAGQPLEPWRAALRRQGRLAHGALGDLAFDLLVKEVTAFATLVQPHLAGPALPPQALDLTVGSFRLVGRIDSFTGQALTLYRFGQVRAQDRLRLWVRHLAARALPVPGYPDRAVFIGREKTGATRVTLGLTENPRDHLEAILALYWRGLTEPLPFFPKTSYAYAEKLHGGRKGNTAAALAAARTKWQGYYNRGSGKRVPGEGDSDPHFRFCFGAEDPLGSQFETLARQVFDPLLAVQNEEPIAP